jgi:alkylation response protein AidB-like acyl-CoA dehydrogenase
MTEPARSDQPRESVDEFAARAGAWLADHMPRLEREPVHERRDDIWDRQRELQRMLWDGGFAGICVPAEYGGLGLPVEYQRAFTRESLPYELPFYLSTPTFSIIVATLIDFGTPEQQARHLPGILRGDHIWVQFLSEPSGGSDLAACLTRADRRDDAWVLNGSKIWSSGAEACDFALCLARTNWDVPKHAGLSMFVVDLHQPGVTIEPIEQVNHNHTFCQEFFDDVVLPLDALVGELDDGWRVATALLAHEREGVGGSSPYVSGRNLLAPGSTAAVNTAAVLAREQGVDGDPVVRQLVGEQRMIDLVQRGLVERVTAGVRSGALPSPAGALLKLYTASASVRKVEIAMTIAGTTGALWPEGDAAAALLADRYLIRQADSISGGTSEIQRNIISERVLGLPREQAADRGVPYREVRQSSRRAPAPDE